ncbi:MAG: hypothetical protein AABX82_04580, partial [Nanoarchaeota archaeon]
RIGKNSYEVLERNKRIDYYDVEKKQVLGEHLAVQLHRVGYISLHPTHLLKIYSESDASIFKIVQERPPNWLKKTRQRGNSFCYVDERKIVTTEIIVESSD